MASTTAFRFGPFVLSPATLRLQSPRGSAALSPRATDLLLMFVEQPARLFTKDEIFQVLWPDVAVTDNALTQVISEIRRALGDTPGSARYVQTMARRGYRFVAPVTRVAATGLERATPRSVSPARSIPRPGTRTISVPDFLNVSRDRPLAWLSTGIAEAVANGLRAVAELVVIERSAVGRGPVEVVSDLVVVGAFQCLGDELRMTARVVDEGTREAIAHAMVDGARRSAFVLEDALARELVASLAAARLPGRADAV